MSELTVQVRRPRRPDMFADLLPGVAVAFETVVGSRGWFRVSFSRDLTAEETAAVVARLESTDDADMASRAALDALADTVRALDATPERLLLLASVDRILDA